MLRCFIKHFIASGSLFHPLNHLQEKSPICSDGQVTVSQVHKAIKLLGTIKQQVLIT